MNKKMELEIDSPVGSLYAQINRRTGIYKHGIVVYDHKVKTATATYLTDAELIQLRDFLIEATKEVANGL